MNEDDYSDIKEIPIYSEKELNAEYENMSTILNDINTDWNKRFNAIKRLEGLILGGAPQIDSFPTVMSKLYLHLTVQLNDLRSAISKEACRLVCLSAKVAGERLESLCDKLISKDGLLKIINSGNKIIAENGNECIITLIQYVRSAKIITRIIEEFQSKNTAVRQRVSAYLKMIIESYSDSVIEKYATGMENAIALVIADANKDVRQNTRQAFLIYQSKFPQKAAKLLVKFESSVQKALIEE